MRIALKHTSADSRVSFIINNGFIISLQNCMPPAFVEDYVINSCSRQYCNFEQLFRITQTVLVTTKALYLEVFFISLTFHICHPSVFLLTHIVSLLLVIHTIHSIMQTKIQGLHVSTVYGHLQALFLYFSLHYAVYGVYD